MVLTGQLTIPKPQQPTLRHPASAAPLPAEVELILSAIETGRHGYRERRSIARAVYRVQASLRLFSDQPNTPPATLYTRDVNQRGLGFITKTRLALGHGGLLDITLPDGRDCTIACTLLRCREATPEWFEGSVYFNRQQLDFAV
ncbi:MAG TPA: hypothetical protein VFE47_09925 [Tepidisphaeraceae bacterium]|nr:hypothetical protein [Tepidisphaeraceae bacterium]